MNTDQLREILGQVKRGNLDVEEALDRVRWLPYEDIGFAKIDHHRPLRTGFPEAILCQGKTPGQIVAIVERLLPSGDVILATKAGPEVFAEIRRTVPSAEYNELARLVVVGKINPPEGKDPVLLLTAGTADIPVAEEVAVTAQAMGSPVERVYDVGVAGLHRLLDCRSQLVEARVIVAVAGMEGALASIVSGMVSVPVIAVPTSVGYGAGFQGLAALLGMLNTCAPGVAVVNIDNGFGAGYLAGLILRQGDISR